MFVVAKLKTADSGVFLEARLAHVIRCGVHDCVRAILTSPKTLASNCDFLTQVASHQRAL